MRRDIRLLVLGDEKVGKSSIIAALVTEAFPEEVPHVLPEISIPPSTSPENVGTTIVDSSSRPEDRVQLESQIRSAQVISLVYDVSDEKTFSRLTTFWLPYIRSLGVNVPVVLVSNKIDLRGMLNGEPLVNEDFADQILPIMNEFKEVESCVECSALTLSNIPEVFYFAQKSLLYPTSPLYDSREADLKVQCKRALLRIFSLADRDQDHLLNDEELNLFQLKCFGQPLQQVELEGIKELLREAEVGNGGNISSINSGGGALIKSMGITADGFVHLQKLFIQRGRLETTWAILRTFGYDDDLSLSEEFLHPAMDVPSDARVELSAVGYQFFTELFSKFDIDKDGVLNDGELKALFSTCCAEESNPWISMNFPECTLTDFDGSVTLHGFLSLWAMTTFLDYEKTLEYLAYLGFESADTRNALRVVRNRNGRDRLQRDVFFCLVVGAPGSGKTAILRSFIERSFSNGYVPTPKCNYAVNSVELAGSEKFLIMLEISQHQGYDQYILNDPSKIDFFDAICYTFDSSDPQSFSYIVNFRDCHPELLNIPSIVVACKSDLDRASQRSESQPDEYCINAKMATPLYVSAKDGVLASLFERIIETAIKHGSHHAISDSIAVRYRCQIVTGAIFGGASIAVLTAAFFLLRLFSKK